MKHIRILFFIVTLSLMGCKTYKPLEIGEPRNLKLESLSESTVDLSMELPIRNPNIYRIKVTRVEGSAFINDKKAGDIKNTEKVRLAANSDRIHDVMLRVDYSDLLSGGMSVMSILREGEVTLSLKGSLIARSFLYKKELDFDRESKVNLAR
ncbi:MAG: LEA type 2 family protein [Bacteroidota bacterium]